MSVAYDVSRATARAEQGRDTVAVVLALPGDTVESVLQRVLAADTPTAHIVIAEETTCLRRVRDTNFLRRAAQQAGLRLTIVTADSLTMTASRWSGLDVAQCAEEPPDDLDGAAFSLRPQDVPAIAVLEPAAAPAQVAAQGAGQRATPEPASAVTARSGNARTLILALLLLIGAILGWLAYERAVVDITVTPPRAPDQVVALVLDRTAAAALALQPIVRSFDVQFSSTVRAPLPLPLSAARGRALLRNSSSSALDIPAGSRFVARSGDTSIHAFEPAGALSVPAATILTGTLGAVSIPGELQFNLTAVEAGSTGNIAADTLQELRLPDGSSVSLNTERLTISHAAFSGGTDDVTATLTDGDVRAAIEARRSILTAQAEAQLRDAATADGLMLLPTVSGGLESIALNPLQIEPPLGARLNSSNDRYTVTLRITAQAQAAPFDEAVQRRSLTPVFEQALITAGVMPADSCRHARLDNLQWDGMQIAATGTLVESGTCVVPIDMTTQLRLRDALRGLDNTAARELLETYRLNGTISDYQLPTRDQLPGWSWLIRLQTP